MYRNVWRTVLFACAYVLVALLGRLTVGGSDQMALIWPAPGVATLWMLSTRGTRRLADAVVLGAATYVVDVSTDMSSSLALVFVLAGVSEAVLAAELLRRACPELWGCGGQRDLDDSRLLARFLFVLTVAAVDGTAIGVVGSVLIGGSPAPEDVGLWAGRNLCGIVVVTALGLLVAHWLSQRPRPRLVAGGAGSHSELIVLMLVTAAGYAFVMGWQDQPLAFPLLATTVWAGSRFSPLVTMLHSTAASVTVLWLTFEGHGPFAAIGTRAEGGMLSQAFVIMVAVTGLALAVGRAERRGLARELEQARDEALFQADLLGKIVDSMTEGLAVVQDDETLLMHNPAAGHVLGLPLDSKTPVSWSKVSAVRLDGTPLPPEDLPSARALAGEVVLNHQMSLRGLGDPKRVISISSAPLPVDRRSGHRRAVLLFHDATAEHEQRAELGRFAGVVAHDLLGPLASIQSWAALVAEELDRSDEIEPAVAGEFARRVKGAAERMRSLIRDLLAHATSGDKALDLRRVDLTAVVSDVVAGRSAEDSVTVAPIPPVQADEMLVRQLLDNLIGNALKYVHPDVQPRILVAGAAAGAHVRVTVIDNGIGLPAGTAEHIFDEFYRAHQEGYSGTGLGLAICRRIVERHGGSIGVRPNPAGQGTVFEFTLPAHEAPAVEDPATPAPRARRTTTAVSR